jgi:hypothetical protein
MTAGYGHASYAASLAEFGTPRVLPRCNGSLLERPIAGTSSRDAMGCYPLFACADWSGLPADLESIGRDLVSVVLVADPFGNHDPAMLDRVFNRGAMPFKEHQIVAFDTPLEQAVSSHHRRNVKKSLRAVEVERVLQPEARIEDWSHLYGNLVRRHSISGLRAFSKHAFALQLATPGMLAFRAVHAAETVGMALFYVQGEVAYYHLGAYSDEGYTLGAAFAIFWTALNHFATAVKYVSLGGDAGIGGDAGGLSRFKRGWATETRIAYLCKHVGDPGRYAELSRGRPATEFFPAYRDGEYAPPSAAEESRDHV